MCARDNLRILDTNSPPHTRKNIWRIFLKRTLLSDLLPPYERTLTVICQWSLIVCRIKYNQVHMNETYPLFVVLFVA